VKAKAARRRGAIVNIVGQGGQSSPSRSNLPGGARYAG
jgi:hypothetical protein